jgi:hypothetical protein
LSGVTALSIVRDCRAKSDRVRPSGCRTTDDPEGLSPQAALARGWCQMEANRPIEAAKAFEVALRGSGRTKSDAAYGQSLAYMRAGLNDMAAVSATKAPLNSSRSIELRAALLASRAVPPPRTVDSRALSLRRRRTCLPRGGCYRQSRRHARTERCLGSPKSPVKSVLSDCAIGL